MYETLRFRLLSGFYAIVALFCTNAAWADDEKPAEWVLPYFIVVLFVTLGTLALLHLTKRSETSLSLDEVAAAKREQLKK